MSNMNMKNIETMGLEDAAIGAKIPMDGSLQNIVNAHVKYLDKNSEIQETVFQIDSYDDLEMRWYEFTQKNDICWKNIVSITTRKLGSYVVPITITANVVVDAESKEDAAGRAIQKWWENTAMYKHQGNAMWANDIAMTAAEATEAPEEA